MKGLCIDLLESDCSEVLVPSFTFCHLTASMVCAL